MKHTECKDCEFSNGDCGYHFKSEIYSNTGITTNYDIASLSACDQYGNCMFFKSKPQGEYEFIEILAQYVPDDICTYPEYKGKPYYSIHYRQNGEEFVGFGTYNPEVLSGYLKKYFMKGNAE